MSMLYCSPMSIDRDGARVHLIPVDLWEQISGEHLTPEHICELQDAEAPTAEDLRILSMATDRADCRTLQQQLETGGDKFAEKVLHSLSPKFSELLADQSANYVIQKLCEVANSRQRASILSALLLDIERAVKLPNGCRIMQKFIERAVPEQNKTLFNALKPTIFNLCLSVNGNHIVRRFIDALPESIDEIIEILRPHVLQLVIDNCGCRVIQKLFESVDITRLEPLVWPVLSEAPWLAMNQYGNYVIQIILCSKNAQYVDELVKRFQGRFYEFSMHKFASNVIEKCIREASSIQREHIFTEIAGQSGNYNENNIYNLAIDQFGNYVMQRMIEYGSSELRDEIFTVVDDNYFEMRQIPYPKHVIGCLVNMGYSF